MPGTQPHRFKTISEYHQFRGLPKPEHPLISVINFEDIKQLRDDEPQSLTHEFYSIALKRNFDGKFKYGQQEYDFDEGIMFLISPGQVFSFTGNRNLKHSGWMLFIHPDFLWNTPMAQKIKQYEYFNYSVHEALHLSEKEEAILITLLQNISQEYHANIDKFSQDVIIAQIELLLTYTERFYNRQFITRKISNHQILNRFEEILAAYFNSNSLAKKGLPTVGHMPSS